MSLREDRCPLTGRFRKGERISYMLEGASLWFYDKQVEILTLVKTIREMGDELIDAATDEQRVRLNTEWPLWELCTDLEDFDNYYRSTSSGTDFTGEWSSRYPMTEIRGPCNSTIGLPIINYWLTIVQCSKSALSK